MFGFLTSSSTTRLYRGRAPRQSVSQFHVLPHMRQCWETMTSFSAGHIILTPTQPVGSGGGGGGGSAQRGSNPGPPHQESRALPTELPRPPHVGADDESFNKSCIFLIFRADSEDVCVVFALCQVAAGQFSWCEDGQATLVHP